MNQRRSTMVTAGLLAVLAAGLAPPAGAATLSLQISDSTGKPLADAVAYALPKNGKLPPASEMGIIDQVDRQFVPLVSVYQTGTAIKFPNKDNIRHNVYSFSPPKTFELRLYSGVPAKPVVFDKPGLVVLGCNIHDQRVAYIQVVDTPWFGKTDAAGNVSINDLPPGGYEVRAWHYRLANPNQEFSRTLNVNTAAKLAVRLELKP